MTCHSLPAWRFDPDWLNEFNGASTNAEMLSFIARDIANPSSADPFFPVVRHRDWFAGHSWASGVANGAGSRDQESSTEGVNAYYGTLVRRFQKTCVFCTDN